MRRSPVRIRSMALSHQKPTCFFLLCLAGFFREACNRTGVEDSGNAAVAQLVEPPPCKRQVVGSIPTGSSIGVVAQLVERFVRNEKVTGSTPASSTSFFGVFLQFFVCLWWFDFSLLLVILNMST